MNVPLPTILAILLASPLVAQVPLLSAEPAKQQLFALSQDCQACHNTLVSPAGQDVSIGSDWRASMMAHSALDPYWQASVRREALVRPKASAAIQDECAACHMPKARYKAKIQGAKGEAFVHMPAVNPIPGKKQPPRSTKLARDGASCSICHQIKEEKLGTKASFTAGFVVDTETPLGQRSIFGPFEVDEGRTRIMRSATKFEPHQATHVQESALCGSCHTLYTHARDKDGTVVGELPEQVPYLEWLHSDYPDRESCQSCHMPVVEEKMPVTAVIGILRPQLSRHVFRGGNFFMLGLLDTHRQDLGVTTPSDDLAASVKRTTRHLTSRSATVHLEDLELGPDRLELVVAVKNLAGHKLPTAYPSRRAWLHVKVEDVRGRVALESGALNADGSIVGNDNDGDASRFEPHRREIASPEEVQIYEAIMATPEDEVTTVLLSAIRFIKDNRLLPTGFNQSTAHDDIAVQGKAVEDGDFDAGTDRVRYIAALGATEAPYTVTAELWYQPIAFRWAQNLLDQPSAEAKRFVRYYNRAADRSANVLASTSKTLK